MLVDGEYEARRAADAFLDDSMIKLLLMFVLFTREKSQLMSIIGFLLIVHGRKELTSGVILFFITFFWLSKEERTSQPSVPCFKSKTAATPLQAFIL